MNTVLEVNVEPSTLMTSIKVIDGNAGLLNELRLFLSNISETYQFNAEEQLFSLEWFEIRGALGGLASIRKKYAVSLKFGEYAEQLISLAIGEKRYLKNRTSDSSIEPAQLEEILESSGFNRTLKEEQKRDVLKLLNLKHAANFSVPGAGKTTTLLAVHCVLKKLNLVSHLFVICPINAFIAWEEEVEEIFGKSVLSIKRLSISDFSNIQEIIDTKPDIILVNYEKLRRDIQPLLRIFFEMDFHLILDESHRIKSGVDNISYNQIIKLVDVVKRRDILSGTPMPQSWADLDPQFEFLWPGLSILPSVYEVSNDENVLSSVNKAIDGLYVRTTKGELHLDDPIINYVEIPMGPIQSELYSLFKSETARIIAGIDRSNIHQFRRIGRSVVKLLQAATNPMLLNPASEFTEDVLPAPQNLQFWELLSDFQKYERSSKIDYLRKRVKEIMEGDGTSKVLIWTYFIRNILLLEDIFKVYNPVSIYGGVQSGSNEDEETREGRIRKFHKDETCRVMIANPQACGEGISLHKVCHHAIYLDRNFNAAFFLQSIDRIHRLGLEKGVETNIEILVSKGTIDTLLIKRLNNKVEAMGYVLEDAYLQSLAYDPYDIAKIAEDGINSEDFLSIEAHVTQA